MILAFHLNMFLLLHCEEGKKNYFKCSTTTNGQSNRANFCTPSLRNHSGDGMGEREKPRQIKMSRVIKPTIFCITPLLHVYQNLQRQGKNSNLKMYEMKLGLRIGSLWAGFHLPWLSSTDGDWDTLRGNMGHTHTHPPTHTHIHAHA